ncbi:MAG: DUF928 domain-containing protein [Cyanobacteria bacterium P01_D01_bin.36]
MAKLSKKKITLTASTIGAALLSPFMSSATVLAITTPPTGHLAQSRPPRPSRPPAGLVSGATRDECLITNAAVDPDDNHISHVFPLDSEYSYASYTSDSSPTLWVHLPYAVDENSPVEFVLKRAETREIVYSSGATAIATNAGLVGFSTPIGLEPNVGYEWIVRVYCNDTTAHNPSQFIKGGIMRVSSESYTDTDFWYDQLNDITAMYIANPNDATTQASWTEMLTATGLSNLPETSVQSVIDLRL